MGEKLKEEIIKYRFEQPEKSFALCQELYRSACEKGDNYLIGYALLYMGDTSLTMGETEAAFSYLDKAVQIQKSYGYDDLLMRTYNILGVICCTINDSCREMEYYYKSLNIAKRQKDYLLQSMLYYNIGELYMDMEDPARAVEFFDQGYETEEKLLEETNVVFPEVERHVNLANIHRLLGEYEQAYKEIKIAEEMNDRTKFILVMGEQVNLLLEMGKQKEAILCMKKIAELPLQEFQRVEYVRILLKTVQLMIEAGQIELAEMVTVKSSKALERKSSDHVKRQLCQMQILIAEAKQDKERQFAYYRRYWKLTKILKESERKSIVLALDKRIRVEKERYKNQKMEKENQVLKEQSYVDSLTGLGNRHGMWKYVNENFYKMQKQRKKFGLMIIDLDRFKHLNDTLGHLEGDRCLKTISKVILQCKGEDCYAVRYGGDEFMLLSTGHMDEHVEAVANRIKQEVYNQKMTYTYEGREEQITVSIGAVNEIPNQEIQFLDYINKADQKLYDAKKNGRDLVIFA